MHKIYVCFVKNKYWIVLIMFVACLLGCATSKEKIKNQECLDAVQTKSLMTNYELTIPDGWCSSLGIHDVLGHSPYKQSFSEAEYYHSKVYVNAYDMENYKSKDIEEAFKAHIVGLDMDIPLKPIYDSENHEVYGKYYLVKNALVVGFKQYFNLKALFNYKNQDYIINYYALEKDFDTYLPEVIQMIATFKIKEMP